MGACVETEFRHDRAHYSKDKPTFEFSVTDIVPIKYRHFISEYEFEKNLPAVKDSISNQFTFIEFRGATC